MVTLNRFVKSTKRLGVVTRVVITACFTITGNKMRHIQVFLEVLRHDWAGACAIFGYSRNMPRFMINAITLAQEEDIERLRILAQSHKGDVLAAYEEGLKLRGSRDESS